MRILVLLVGIIILSPFVCKGEEYGSKTVFQGKWGRPEPGVRERALGASPLSAVEEERLGYEPEHERDDGFQSPASGPIDFAIDKDGNFWIVDLNKKRVVKFSSQGKYLLSIKNRQDDMPYFNQPVSIAIDGQGNIYIKDLDQDKCIFMFDSSGNLLLEITSLGVYSSEQIGWICSTLEPDNRGNIFIRAEIDKKGMINFKIGNGGRVIEEFEGPFYWRRDGKENDLIDDEPFKYVQRIFGILENDYGYNLH